jgi:hypothetical protein
MSSTEEVGRSRPEGDCCEGCLEVAQMLGVDLQIPHECCRKVNITSLIVTARACGRRIAA